MFIKASFSLAIFSLGIFISCSSDDGETMQIDQELLGSDPVLNITINNVTYSGTFTTDDIYIAATIGGITTITTSVNANDGTSLVLALGFAGASTGTYTITSGFDDTSNNPTPGINLALFNFTTTPNIEYNLEAQNVIVEVVSYQTQNLFATVSGTFSGTFIDIDTQETFEASGSFNTGSPFATQ